MSDIALILLCVKVDNSTKTRIILISFIITLLTNKYKYFTMEVSLEQDENEREELLINEKLKHVAQQRNKIRKL